MSFFASGVVNRNDFPFVGSTRLVLIIIRWGDCSYLSGRFCLSYLLSIRRMLSEFRVNKFTLSSLFWSEALRGETVLKSEERVMLTSVLMIFMFSSGDRVRKLSLSPSI